MSTTAPKPTGMQNFSQGAGIGSLLGGMFGSGMGGDLSAASMPYLNQVGQYADKYMNPYINAGQGAMGDLQKQYAMLLQNPQQLMQNVGKSFQADPGYQFQVDQMTKAMNNSAAAGGMAGSPAAQQQLAQNVQGMAGQEYNNYMNRALGLYGQGLSGSQGMMGQGFNASSNALDAYNKMLQMQAQLAYASQANQNQSQGGMFGSLGGLVGGIGSLFGL